MLICRPPWLAYVLGTSLLGMALRWPIAWMFDAFDHDLPLRAIMALLAALALIHAGAGLLVFQTPLGPWGWRP